MATGSNSTIEVDELPWNDYYFQEYKAPNGYEIDPYKHYVSIGREESESTVAIEPDEGNSKEDEKKQSIKLKKIDDSTGKPIVGATFKLWRADDFKKTLVSGEGDDAVYSYSLYADGETSIKTIKNYLTNDTIYPITKASAVYMANSTIDTVESKITQLEENKLEKINP